MFEYQQKGQFFAQTSYGLEKLGADELQQHGATNIQTAIRGMYFSADKPTLYRINYKSRFITRILAPLQKFPCHSTRYLYNKAKTLVWEDFLTTKSTFAIFANVSNSKIKHSQYASLCLKDAIVDYFRDKYGDRPGIDKREPDIWINLHIENNWATISFDTSGGSLHRRGYRKESVEAPIKETVAAAIIHYSAWDGANQFYDPMCGSGTLLCEALTSYCNIPAGYLRKKFGFESMPDFDKNLWTAEKNKIDGQIRELPVNVISGSDFSKKTIDAARENLNCLPYGHKIKLIVVDFQNIEKLGNTTIVCNPPYGVRLGEKEDIKLLYKSFGDFLKNRCKTSTAYIYFGDRKLIPNIGLRTSWKKPLNNGGLDGRLAKFDLY